jgi:hypothetical protein
VTTSRLAINSVAYTLRSAGWAAAFAELTNTGATTLQVCCFTVRQVMATYRL